MLCHTPHTGGFAFCWVECPCLFYHQSLIMHAHRLPETRQWPATAASTSHAPKLRPPPPTHRCVQSRSTSESSSASTSTSQQAPLMPRRDFFNALDRCLSRYEDTAAEAEALQLVRQQQAAGGMRAFGSQPQAVPKRIYTIEELRLNGIRWAGRKVPQQAGSGAGSTGACTLHQHGFGQRRQRCCQVLMMDGLEGCAADLSC